MLNITQQRQKVCAEARSWEWTPFHWKSAVKGQRGGVDCGSLLQSVYAVIGVTVTLPEFNTQFMCNSKDEMYLRELEKYSVEVAIPEPGDIVIYKIGTVYSHAGIVIEWPIIIHANARAGFVQRSHGDSEPTVVGAPAKFFSPMAWQVLLSS